MTPIDQAKFEETLQWQFPSENYPDGPHPVKVLPPGGVAYGLLRKWQNNFTRGCELIMKVIEDSEGHIDSVLC